VLNPIQAGQFKRDVKRAGKRGKGMSKLRELLLLLIEQQPLPARFKDHPLKGQWIGFRDAHIEPDWLLIYRIDADTLQLARTGSHADLFDE
jgi:mRNA interferase YafQ